MFTHSSTYVEKSNDDAQTAQRSRSIYLCRSIRGQIEGCAREEENDNRRTVRENRNTANNSLSLGVDGPLSRQRTDRRSCQSARRENIFSDSRRVNENIFKKIYQSVKYHLTIYRLVNILNSVTLNVRSPKNTDRFSPVLFRSPSVTS